MSLMNDVEKHKRMYNLTQHMENVYTLLTPEDIENKWQNVTELVPKRDHSLQLELAKQMNHERLRVEFANLANKVGPWISEKTNVRLAFKSFCILLHFCFLQQETARMALSISGSLENNITSLKTFQQNIISYRPNIDQLETINQVSTIFALMSLWV